jgi:hypothetical protein
MHRLLLLSFLSLFFLASAEGKHHVRANTIEVYYEPEKLETHDDGSHGYRRANVKNYNNFAVDVQFNWNGNSECAAFTGSRSTTGVPGEF